MLILPKTKAEQRERKRFFMQRAKRRNKKRFALAKALQTQDKDADAKALERYIIEHNLHKAPTPIILTPTLMRQIKKQKNIDYLERLKKYNYIKI